MSVYHAICTGCRMSVHFERTREDVYACPYCGRSFSYAELSASCSLVNVEEARNEYVRAQHFFSKRDYKNAELLFDKVRAMDRNNFYAEYYYRLCNIKVANSEGRLCGAEVIILLLDAPIEKLVRSALPQSIRRMFLVHAFKQVYELMKELFEAIGRMYPRSVEREQRNKEYLMYARGARRITLLDPQTAMLGDEEIAVDAVSVCDLAMCALRRVSAASVVDMRLELPPQAVYDECRSLFSVYRHFATKTVPGYVFPHYRESYAELAAFTAKADAFIADYSRICGDGLTRGLSVQGDKLTHMLHFCRVGFDYIYFTVFRSFGCRTDEEEAAKYLCCAVRYALQLLTPRVFSGEDGPAFGDVSDEADAVVRPLGTVCSELAVIGKPSLASVLEKFYADVYLLVARHYGDEKARISTELEYAKSAKNKRYFYYRNFLYGVAKCARPAFAETVPFTDHRRGDRLKLLRLCKSAADDLLYLFDYRTVEMEKNPKFADLPDLYADINTNIRRFA